MVAVNHMLEKRFLYLQHFSCSSEFEISNSLSQFVGFHFWEIVIKFKYQSPQNYIIHILVQLYRNLIR